jgi:hypothetical protein
LPPLEEPTCLLAANCFIAVNNNNNNENMSPAHYMMCKGLVRTAAEKAAAAAAASSLIELSNAASTPSGPGAVAAATAKTPAQAKTMPDITAKEASCGKLRALCAAANLVNSTLRLLSLRAFDSEAVGACQKDAPVEEDVPQQELVGPQPDVVISRVAVAGRDGDDAAPVTVENVPETGGDAPAGYAYRHSWRRRRNVPVVVAASDDNNDAPVTSEARGAVRSTGRRAARIRIVVAGAVVGICEAAPVFAENSLEVDDDDDLPPMEEVDASSSSFSSSTAPLGPPDALWTSKKHVAVAVSPEAPDLVIADGHLSPQELWDMVQPMLVQHITERWHERLRRRGRGANYAAVMAAVMPQRRRRGEEGGEGGRRRA